MNLSLPSRRELILIPTREPAASSFLDFSVNTAMPKVSLAVRNVLVYDGTNNTVVAGCRQFGTLTASEFYACLAICFVSPPLNQYQLWHQESNLYLPRNAQPIAVGTYFVASFSSAPILNISELSLIFYSRPILAGHFDGRRRAASTSLWRKSSYCWGLLPSAEVFTNIQLAVFRDRVRERDRSCRVTGRDVSAFNWVGVNACHIIPRQHSALCVSLLSVLTGD
jgi:hypothetical protein